LLRCSFVLFFFKECSLIGSSFLPFYILPPAAIKRLTKVNKVNDSVLMWGNIAPCAFIKSYAQALIYIEGRRRTL
jgi:hypothetical protein